MSTLMPELAGPTDLPQDIAIRTIPGALQARAALDPKGLAMVASSAAGGFRRITWGGLAQETERLAAGLIHSGLSRGDRLIIVADNTCAFEAFQLFLAAHRCGVIPVPVNPRSSKREYEYMVDHCEAAGVAYTEGAEFTVTGQPFKAIFNLARIDRDSLPRAGRDAWSRLSNVEIAEEDPADWIYTSGTTARAKCVMFRQSSCVAQGIFIQEAMDLSATDVLQSPYPFFTSSGSHSLLFGSLMSGCTLVVDPGFQGEETVARMERERTTVYAAAPAIYSFMLEDDLLAGRDLSSLRVLWYGGAPMPPSQILRLRKVMPWCDLRQGYGLTESGPTGVYISGVDGLTKIGSVGNRVTRLNEFQIQDEDGKAVDAGVPGEICYRGAANMLGYFKDPKATAAAYRNGWLRSGDVAYVDEEGFVFHVDRLKDLIIRGGHNISSVEIESVVLEHPDVVEAAAFGVPHEHLGEEVALALVRRDGSGLSEADIASHCRARLAKHKCPKFIFVVDVLPRSAMGKVLKRDLRRDLAERP